MQFTAEAIGSAPANIVIGAEASDAAPAFARAVGDFSSRPTLPQTVAWDPPAWTATGAAGTDQLTPELDVLVQAIVDRPGWSAGNAIVLLVSGSVVRAAESFDGVPATRPSSRWSTSRSCHSHEPAKLRSGDHAGG